MRPKPKGLRRFSREELFREMKRFIRNNGYRRADTDRVRCVACSAVPKRGHKPGCPVQTLAWNVEFEIWLSKPM